MIILFLQLGKIVMEITIWLTAEPWFEMTYQESYHHHVFPYKFEYQKYLENII